MMIVSRVRNRGCLPYLETEGEITKPLVQPRMLAAGREWHKKLTPYDRMHNHHTLASVRRYAYFRQFSNLVPHDDLDFKLQSPYVHGVDLFPDCIDVVMQAETIGTDTWRRLRNTRDIQPEKDAIGAAVAKAAGVGPAAGGGGVGGRRGGDGGGGGAGVAVGASSLFGGKAKRAKGLGLEQQKGLGKKLVKYNDYHVLHIGGITERRHPSNVKLMNSSHHSPQTNAGYTRQDSDGNAYQY